MDVVKNDLPKPFTALSEHKRKENIRKQKSEQEKQ